MATGSPLRRRCGDAGIRGSPGLVAVCVLADLLILAPVLVTVRQALTGGWSLVAREFTDRTTLHLIFETLLIAVLVTPICGVLGTVTAWFIERTEIPGRRFWALLMVAPLTIPVFVTSYAWVALSPVYQGLAGAVIITSATYYPIVFLLVGASLRGMDPALEDSARALGCGRWRCFVRVVLPQLRPALLGGMLLVCLDLLVELDAFVALRVQTFSTAIYVQYQTGFGPAAAVLATATTVACVVVLVGEARLRGTASYTRVSHGAPRNLARLDLGRARWIVLAGFLALTAATVGVPVGILVSWFEQSQSHAVAAAAAGVHALPGAALTSVLLGLAAAVVAVLLALPLALLTTRSRSRAAALFERTSYLSYALPDLVAALAIAYGAIHYLRPAYQTVGLLVMAYAILFVPLAVVALRATLGQLEPRLADCARTLGHGPLRTLWRVTLPLIRPGLAAAAVLIFAFTIGDLSTAQVLLPPGMATLATQFSANASTVAFAAAAPYAAVLMGLALIATYVVMSRYARVRMSESR